MANSYETSSKWKGWRAWVKYKGGDVKQYDKMVKRFQRAERYMKELTYKNKYGQVQEYDPQRLAAYNVVFGTDLYENIRKEINQNRLYNDAEAMKRIETKYRLEGFVNKYGDLRIEDPDNPFASSHTVREWYNMYINGEIPYDVLDAVLFQTRHTPEYTTSYDTEGGGDY